MAVPIDHSQNIQGIAQGLQNAMPGIEAAMPGDPLIDQFLNEYTRRRESGEPKENIMQDLLNQVKSKPELMQMQNPATSDIGTQNGQVALGPQGGLTQPVASGPNTMAPQPQPQQTPGAPIQQQAPPMSATPPTPAIPQSQPPMSAPAPGGLQAMGSGRMGPMGMQSAPPNPAASFPTGQPQEMDASNWGKSVGYTPEGAIPADNPGKSVVKAPPDAPLAKGDGISLMGKSKMQTAVSNEPPAPPVTRNRGQQERAMAGVRQVEAMDAQRGSADYKTQKLEMDMRAKAIKSMVEMRKNDATFMKDFANFAQSVEGMDTKKQMFMADLFMKAHMNDADNAAALQRTRIMANRPRGGSGSGEKLPAKLAEIRRHIFEARGQYSKYDVMGMADDPANVETVNAAKKREAAWIREYEKEAKKLGWPIGIPEDDGE